MATQITNKSDMTGNVSLTISNADSDNFNSIVLYTEEEVTRQLLGDGLYNAFESDVDAGAGTPTEQKHLDLLNGVTWSDDDGVIHNLEGLKESYKYFVYYEWLNQSPYVNNFVGKARNVSENSDLMDRQSLNIESQNRYNIGTKLYDRLVEFVMYYEVYNVDADSIVEAPAGTYTVSLTDTTYLVDGDTVLIEGEEYTVANLVVNTSFEFTADPGLTFSNLEVTWYPFEDALLGDKKPIYFNGMV